MFNVHGSPDIQQANKHGFGIFWGYSERGGPRSTFCDAQIAIGYNGLGLDARTGAVDPTVLGTGKEPIGVVRIINALETISSASPRPLNAIK